MLFSILRVLNVTVGHPRCNVMSCSSHPLTFLLPFVFLPPSDLVTVLSSADNNKLRSHHRLLSIWIPQQKEEEREEFRGAGRGNLGHA